MLGTIDKFQHIVDTPLPMRWSQLFCVIPIGNDVEFWLSAQPNGYMHTGLFNEWNISTSRSIFTVAAETESDVSETVRFAHDHNLRLVVKGTGHDW